MPDSNDQKYFVRIHGKNMGPFSFDQLLSLKNRGRLHADHEVSADGRQWKPASQMEGLFEQPRQEEPQPTGSARAAQSTQWFYTIGDEQEGPVSFSKLKKMCRKGTISEEDLVWHDGLDEWIPADEVDGLFDDGRKSQKNRKTTKASSAVSESRGLTIVWDAILNGTREQVSDDGLDSSMRRLIQTGGIAMTISTLACAGFIVVQAIKIDSIQFVLWGLGAVIGISVLKYAAVHLSFAGDALIRSTPNSLSTPAMVNVMAVILLFLGIGGAAASVYYALATDSFDVKVSLLGLSGQSLIVLGFSAFAALRPSWLNIEIRSGARAGEEGIAVLSFFLKLLMRLASVTFGIGAIIGAFGFIVGLGCLIVGGDWLVNGFAFAFAGAVQTLIAGLTPLVGYLMFIAGSIGLDISQSLISLPGKLKS